VSLFVRSVLVGIVATAFLVSVAILAGQTPGLPTFGSTAIYLLAPGILLGFAVGSGNVHDTSFWVLTAVLNALIYSLVAALCLLILGKIRSRSSSRTANPEP
jgi:hypothetical protein